MPYQYPNASRVGLEDYSTHWPVDVTAQTVLDLGADYGSTAKFFLEQGARQIIAVEGDPALFSRLKQLAAQDPRITAISLFIQNPKQLEELLTSFYPEVVKMDIEGAEAYLLTASPQIVGLPQLYAVETHNDQLHVQVLDYFSRLGYRVLHDFRLIAWYYVTVFSK